MCQPDGVADPVRTLQRDILHRYAKDLGLDPDARYISGTPLRPLPPLDTHIGGLMIVGAYPSARFATMGRHRDVPVGDNLGPFEPERYFDGDRVRTQRSADELHSLFLEPLAVSREVCWVTDLVKVFLFKQGHRAKYESLGGRVPIGYRREDFDQLAAKSTRWLGREIEVAQPALLLTLGAEVAGLIRGIRGQQARNSLLGPTVTTVTIDGHTVDAVHLAHPGILMRGESVRNPWPAAHREHIASLAPVVAERGLCSPSVGSFA